MNGLFRVLFSMILMGLMASCAHTPPPGPWDLIKNEDARKKYMMIQQAAGSMKYKKLYYNIKLLHELYPEENVIAITHAGIYGDYGQTMSEEKEKEHKQKAIEMLKPYVNKTYKSMISQDRIMAFNQYYYHSGQFLKQYEYGNLIVTEGGMGGEVLVAVGASMYALKLDQSNQRQQAQVYAIEARKAWEEMYDLTHPVIREAAFQNAFYVSSIALSGGCTLATSLFKDKIMTTRRHKEMPRWYSQFNPKHLKSCGVERQISGQ